MRIRLRYVYLVALSSAGYLLSFASQLVISYYLGTSANLDAYWVALSVVNLLMFYVHPLREAIVPGMHKFQGDTAAANSYFSKGLGLVFVLSLVTALAAVAMPEMLAGLAVSGQQAQIAARAAELIRYLAPAILFFALSEILNGLFTVYNRILWQAGTRLLGAASTLSALALLVGMLAERALVVAFIFAQAVTMIMQIILLYRLGLRYRPTTRLWLDRKFATVSGALLISYGLTQVYAIFEKNTFTHFSAGLVSAFQYSQALVNAVISIVAYSLTSILWPKFLEQTLRNDARSISNLMAKASRFLALALTGICLFGMLESRSIVDLVFARGAFDATSVESTAQALRVSVFTAVAIALGSVIGRVIISRQRAAAVAWIGLSSTTAGLAVLFLARIANSEVLAMSHWLVANAVGLAVSCWFYAKLVGFDNLDLMKTLSWILRLVLIGLVLYWAYPVTEGGVDSMGAKVLALGARLVMFGVVFALLALATGLIGAKGFSFAAFAPRK